MKQELSKVSTANTANKLTSFQRSSLIEMSDGLTVQKLALREDPIEVIHKRLALLRLLYRDCQSKMKAYKAEADELNAQLAKLEKEGNIGNTEGVEFQIGMMIAEADKQLNVNKGFVESQIDYLAKDIRAVYPFLMLPELALIFRRGIMGNYGKSDYRLDAQIVHGWIKDYIKEKEEIQALHRKKEEERLKSMSFIGR